MPKLYAIADLHVGHGVNGRALESLQSQPPGTGLILAGDLGETLGHARSCFVKAKACFTHVFWVPGNHELYSVSHNDEPADSLRGEAKYLALVDLARQHGVHTPEDEWVVWEYSHGNGNGNGQGQGKAIIALIFTLYDYSFRPAHVTREGAIEWARAGNNEATDEALLHADPYATRDAWCHALCDRWAAKFRESSARHPDVPYVIVNHWPLREDLVYIPLVPRFTLWCGTKRTADWHRRGSIAPNYPGAMVVVTGHLHVRRTDVIDGTRFEEVSLGYPRQWEKARDEEGKTINEMLRQILPGQGPYPDEGKTMWRMKG